MSIPADSPVSRPSFLRKGVTARLAVTSRLLAALAGGYLLANAVAIFLARLLLLGSMARADGVLTAVFVSFLIYVGAVIWAFAARNATRAWVGLLLLSGFFGAAAWLLGSGEVL